MDRFIVIPLDGQRPPMKTLKSNMDRFIAEKVNKTNVQNNNFKIQYG